jgi:hypothetical protein
VSKEGSFWFAQRGINSLVCNCREHGRLDYSLDDIAGDGSEGEASAAAADFGDPTAVQKIGGHSGNSTPLHLSGTPIAP